MCFDVETVKTQDTIANTKLNYPLLYHNSRMVKTFITVHIFSLKEDFQNPDITTVALNHTNVSTFCSPKFI